MTGCLAIRNGVRGDGGGQKRRSATTATTPTGDPADWQTG